MFNSKQRKLIGIGGILSMVVTGAVVRHYYGVPSDDKILMSTTDFNPANKKETKKVRAIGTSVWMENQDYLSFLTEFGKLKERVKRVETELKLPVAIAERKNEDMSLEDRMRYYNVPGISISVINNFQIDYSKVYGVSMNRKKLNLKHMFPLDGFSSFVTSILMLKMISNEKSDQLTSDEKNLGNDRKAGNELQLMNFGITNPTELFKRLQEHILKPLDIHDFQLGSFKKTKRNIAFGHHKMKILEPSSDGYAIWTTTSNIARIFCELMKSKNDLSNFLLEKELTDKILIQNENGYILEGDPDIQKIIFKKRENGYSYYFIGYPNIGKGAILISNSDTGGELLNEVIRSIADVYKWPDLKQQHKSIIPNLDQSKLSNILGVYELENGKTCKITLNENNRLFFSQGNHSIREEIFTNDYHTFFNQFGLVLHLDDKKGININSPLFSTKNGKMTSKK